MKKNRKNINLSIPKGKDLMGFERNEEEEELEILPLLEQTKDHTYSEEMTTEIEATVNKTDRVFSFILIFLSLILFPLYLCEYITNIFVVKPFSEFSKIVDLKKNWRDLFGGE